MSTELTEGEIQKGTGQPISRQDRHDQARLAILDVVEALSPEPFTEKEVVLAVGDARSANAVSRAARARLPHKT